MRRFDILLLIILFCTSSSTLFGQDLIDSDLPPSEEHQLFGKSVAISWNWALIGAPQKDIGEKKSVGSVFFYQKSSSEGWENITEITPANIPAFSNFGTSIDILEGQTAAISSMGSVEGGLYSEAVFIYEMESGEWTQSQILKPSDAKRGMRFGTTLTFINSMLDDNLLAVGAYNADGMNSKTGAVYIFHKSDSGWVETQKLVASDGESNDYFGHSLDFVSLEYSRTPRLVIGAYNATGAEERSGAVYVFDLNEDGLFEESGKIYDPNGSSSDLFGFSVEHIQPFHVIVKQSSLSNCTHENQLFIGAPGANSDFGQTGTVYSACNDGENWFVVNEFSDPNSSENEHFGTSLTSDPYNGLLFVGANRSNNKQGTIYSYQYFDGSLVSPDGFGNLPIAPEITEGEYFGTSIASSELGDIVVSSPYKTISGNENSGAVYFYNYTITSNEEEQLGRITEYKLEQNYPNPFNPTTTINYQVRDAGNVKLTVFNILGQAVQVLVDEYKVNGAYNARFDASSLASGFYFYTLEVNDFTSTKKMMLIK